MSVYSFSTFIFSSHQRARFMWYQHVNRCFWFQTFHTSPPPVYGSKHYQLENWHAFPSIFFFLNQCKELNKSKTKQIQLNSIISASKIKRRIATGTVNCWREILRELINYCICSCKAASQCLRTILKCVWGIGKVLEYKLISGDNMYKL